MVTELVVYDVGEVHKIDEAVHVDRSVPPSFEPLD